MPVRARLPLSFRRPTNKPLGKPEIDKLKEDGFRRRRQPIRIQAARDRSTE
jgi:hypothetical protein